MSFDIQISDLRKSYGKIRALDGLNLQAVRGEMLGLIGPDGAGKTTTLRILCGLLDADSGDCFVNGKNVKTDLKEIHSFIGYMPQRFSLYPDLTVAENLRFFADLFNVPKKERENRLERLLHFSKLGPFSKRKAADLSGGMKQKLALSCTLIHTPKILFLDEPTTGVDPVSRREFWDILHELKSEGVTILITTPYMDEAAKCDRVAFIHNGRILTHGKPKDIPEMFHGQLFELKCSNPVRVAKLFQSGRGIDSVWIFGDRLHLSGPDIKGTKETITAVLHENDIQKYSLEKISASIEDVFVDLMK
ncbi:MAG: ATP-binding cassette domain-containing protein [Actinobacteria bacterium]|nr:ATP-binding cassette domain-containing protein [Actinomycetota bacterium]